MSGPLIIRAMLRAHAPLTAKIPAARIEVGGLPQGAVLPAISITEISAYTVQDTTRRRTATEAIRSRVQVTVYTKDDYATLKQVLLLAKMGPGVHAGQIGPWFVNSVTPAGVGPEIPRSDDLIYEQSRDFMVTFAEAN